MTDLLNKRLDTIINYAEITTTTGPSQQCVKKLIMIVWRSMSGFVHSDYLKTGQTMTPTTCLKNDSGKN